MARRAMPSSSLKMVVMMAHESESSRTSPTVILAAPLSLRHARLQRSHMLDAQLSNCTISMTGKAKILSRIGHEFLGSSEVQFGSVYNFAGNSALSASKECQALLRNDAAYFITYSSNLEKNCDHFPCTYEIPPFLISPPFSMTARYNTANVTS
jgi:hypothetical protein